eukprot:GFKZ01012702.1.p1 GENE.GFKZ01012702.1~~GFKZ01012702.1.p1  ORF type:complete len:297 (+),score=38.05 GFKZ01012702.1:173-1063(+)
MAFVPGLPISQTRSSPLSQSTFAPHGLPTSPSTTPLTTPRMGYGAYSYSTDKTKGHVNQYYVDKFRIISDFAKGPPKTIADAKLGRNIKGGVAVPEEGIPQDIDPVLLTGEPMVDPRIAEAEGSVYSWDINFANPAFLPETYADVNDDAVAKDALAKFRSSMVDSRTKMLSAMDFGAAARISRIKEGLDERYLLSLDGALDVAYARLQKIADLPTFTPTGEPQTEIPGIPFLGSVGALDLIENPSERLAFWKEKQVEPMMIKPGGKDTPELPYSASPSLEEMKESQKARGLLPSDE